MSDLQKKLAKYAALGTGLGLLAPQQANGQIVYTDIPDETVTNNDGYALDMNNDALADFNFSNFYSFWSSCFPTTYGCIPSFWSSSSMAVNGTSVNTLLANTGSSIAQLDFDENISSLASFTPSTNGTLRSSWCATCEWNTTVTDKYIGVAMDIGGSTHYGWIRIDLTPGSQVVIKDFAYEGTPNTAIKAGDNGTVSSIEGDLSESINIYPNPATDNLIVASQLANGDSKVRVYNTQGVLMSSAAGNLNVENNLTLDIQNLEAGIYIVEVSNDHALATFKITKE